MKEPKYTINQIIGQHGSNWHRIIKKIVPDYLGKEGRIGYLYEDEFGTGLCSEENLTRWIKNRRYT